MQQLQQAEVSRAQAAQAKNELEAYIISTQGRLADDEGVEAITTDKQRQSFQSELSKVEDWLYDQVEHEQAPVFRFAFNFMHQNVCIGELSVLVMTPTPFRIEAVQTQKCLPRSQKYVQSCSCISVLACSLLQTAAAAAAEHS